ncbi:relaxase [Actinoplanes cyaneus]|uniref:relaxase n=1 Tax=Actinoplanes cyaneus TaxID=52696 RepID=UPI001EF39589|nr:relaxase [Actinoplanes cyaneus]
MAKLEPLIGGQGRVEVRALARLLEQPVHCGQYPPAQPVWHCSVRNHAADRILSDGEWAHVAREMVAGAGLAAHGDTRAVRWVAVRHAVDHIHIVATLVRQDGATVWLPKGLWRRCQLTARRLEIQYGLRRVGPPDYTGHRYPDSVEISEAVRAGRSGTLREELRGRVRVAAAAAGTEDEFFDVLGGSGVLVRLRTSDHAGQACGYAVALPGVRTAAGQPIYFGGGRLAADMTLPKLRMRWSVASQVPPGSPRPAVNRHARVTALRQAGQAAQDAARAVGDSARSDGNGVQATMVAAADLLVTVARAYERDWCGPLHRAADYFDRAARGRYGWVAAPTSRSQELRAHARLIWLMGRVSGDDDAYAALRLVLQLGRLADAIAQLRAAQLRLHQARDARIAGLALRRVAAGGRATVAVTATSRPTPARTGGGGRRTRHGGHL